jgi:hypothetical protein
LLAPGLGSAGAGALAVPTDGDLAHVRLLVAAELLAIDFQSQALKSGRKLGPVAGTLHRSLADERAHYQALARLMQNSGQSPPTADEIDFGYPRGGFSTRASIARLGWRIETLLLGAYLGAIENVQTPELRRPIGKIAANEAQHLSALAPAAGQQRVGRAFPAALSISAASDALDAFES